MFFSESSRRMSGGDAATPLAGMEAFRRSEPTWSMGTWTTSRRGTTLPSGRALRAFEASVAWWGVPLKLNRAPASPRDQTLGGSNEALTPSDAPFSESDHALEGKDRILEPERPVLDAEDCILEREGAVLDAEDRILEREGPVLDAEDRILEQEGPSP
jgi:hypothetical protein